MPSYLTRRVSFAAAHRYRIADWSEERNAAVFGACARPNYHGHSYVCDVTVTGEIDPVTGFIVDLGLLDEVLEREVRTRFDHANISTSPFSASCTITGIRPRSSKRSASRSTAAFTAAPGSAARPGAP